MAEVIRENRYGETNGRAGRAPDVADMADFFGLGEFERHGRADAPEPHDDVAKGLRELARALESRPLPGVTAVVAWTPVSWAKRPAKVQLLAFAGAELRDRWDVLDPTAEAIGPIFGDLPFAPIVEPVSAEEWRRSVENEGPVWRHVTRRGVLLYSAETENAEAEAVPA